MNLYVIDAEPYWPVATAGGVVVAESEEAAREYCDAIFCSINSITFVGKTDISKRTILYSVNGNY